MNKAFEITGYGKQDSDCTSEYILKLNDFVLVRDVITQILENKSEWGRVGIKTNICRKDEIFGSHSFEYRYGKIIKEIMSENEQYFWKCISSYEVIGISGSGGWNNSNYKIEIKSR